MNTLVLATGAAVAVMARWALRHKTIDATPLLYAKAPFNALSFAIRRQLAWKRGLPTHPNEPKGNLFDFAPSHAREALEQREESLRQRFDLANLHAQSTRHVYRENLYVLDALDTLVTPFAEHLPSSVQAVDVGSQDFRYAFALERWLRHAQTEAPRSAKLTGIELDGHPIYSDLYSRADHAEAYARQTGTPNTRYIVGDYLAVDTPESDVITFFFPFVLSYALVRWGLPLRHFAPESLFEKAAASLRPGGLLVVVNHTSEESDAQVSLLQAIDTIDILGTWPLPNRMVAYGSDVQERNLTIARKRHSSKGK